MKIGDTLRSWSFRLLGPEAGPGEDGHFHVRRPDGSVATLIQTADAQLEATIPRFGDEDTHLKKLIAPLLPIRRMSRLTNAALLNTAVRQMPEERLFVNVGVWNGFTMLAAMEGNEERRCIGVDNFSEFGGPKDAFLERFTSRRAAAHRFFDQDYVDFFAAGLDRPLGVYLYDGEHGYDNQYRGLMIADPFYADDAVIVVDDTNLDRARNATLAFAEDSRHDWEVVYDQRTVDSRHPTLWNGLMVLQAGGGAGGQVTLPIEDSIEEELVERGEGEETLVSVLALGRQDLSDLEQKGREVVHVDGAMGLREAVLEGSRGRYLLVADGESTPSSSAIARSVQQTQAAAQRLVVGS
jgi:hypothetical protein